jgi:hypothetical protein
MSSVIDRRRGTLGNVGQMRAMMSPATQAAAQRGMRFDTAFSGSRRTTQPPAGMQQQTIPGGSVLPELRLNFFGSIWIWKAPISTVQADEIVRLVSAYVLLAGLLARAPVPASNRQTNAKVGSGVNEAFHAPATAARFLRSQGFNAQAETLEKLRIG